MKSKWWLLGGVLLCLGAAPCAKTEYVHVGPNWGALQKLEPSETPVRVTVHARSPVKFGDRLELHARSERAGRLWVVQVDSEDQLDLLFPNEASPDNAIEAGREVRIPPADATWTIEASEPAGLSLVAAIVTTGDADLSAVLGDEKSAAKALVIVENGPAWGLARTVVEVKADE
jgi:hypothetical protein